MFSPVYTDLFSIREIQKNNISTITFKKLAQAFTFIFIQNQLFKYKYYDIFKSII